MQKHFKECVGAYYFFSGFLALVVKNLPANSGDIREADSIPKSERCPGEGM